MSTAPTGLRERKKVATRDRLLAETRDLLEAMPPSKFTTAEIADNAFMSHRSFFRYFGSKTEALLDVCRIVPIRQDMGETDTLLAARCYADMGDEWLGAMVARVAGGHLEDLAAAAGSVRQIIEAGQRQAVRP